jgi:Holliday junction resolvase RusA-like endonuclease
MYSVEFFVHGWAYAKQSFRYAAGHSYQTKNVKKWQNAIWCAAKEAHDGDLLDEAVEVHLDFYVKRDLADLDNLSKCVLDGLQGSIFKNDKRVVRLILTKTQIKDASRIGVHVVVKKAEETK